MKSLDILFTFLHYFTILFNLLGWVWVKTRKAHLVFIVLTFASWFVLGIWYGWGYCFLTDWHWDVKEKLGETNLPNSFIKYTVDKISGGNIDTTFVDVVTLVMFILTILLTIYVNFIQNRTRVRTFDP